MEKDVEKRPGYIKWKKEQYQIRERQAWRQGRFFLYCACAAVLLSSTFMVMRLGLIGNQVEPVLVGQKTMYAVTCEYKTILREIDITIKPALDDPARLDRTACPKTSAEARAEEVPVSPP